MSDNFLYASIAFELWNVLKTRFGGSNGVLLFELEKEICNIKQGNFTTFQYFTKLQKLWDELSSLKPIPNVDGEAAKTIDQYNQSTRLIQFFMGLNEGYDNIRSKILLQNPLPNVDIAYSMILQVEKQRKISHNNEEYFESSAILSKDQYQRKYAPKGDRYDGKKVDKGNLYCDYRKSKGHTREICFKLNGYP